MREEILSKINKGDVSDNLILQIFEYQFLENEVYGRFCKLLHKTPHNIQSILDIPFLPVEFFKTHKIVSGNFEPEITFSSSGTTGQKNSNHYIKHLKVYESAFLQCFIEMYGDYNDYCFLGLLPSYLERPGSSLVYMMNYFVEKTQNSGSGFYLYNHQELFEKLKHNRNKGVPTILLGVSFALLDFAENFEIHFPELIVMETGGMKGRRKELVRDELHQILKKSFPESQIHSEYGMTEMLSQAYSAGNGVYQPSSLIRVLLADPNDPFAIQLTGQGLIRIIDVANIDSCSFLATQDIGKVYYNGSFEVLGRYSNSDMRGCNLMIV